METTIQIDEVNSKTVNTSRGPGTVYEVKGTDGKKYTTFKGQLGKAAAGLKGQWATIVYTERQNGEYTNYYLEKVEAAEPQNTVAVSGNGVTHNITVKEPSSSKDEQIARAVALKAAIEYGSSIGLSMDEIVSHADTFTGWLLTGKVTPLASTEPVAAKADVTDLPQEEFADADGVLVDF